MDSLFAKEKLLFDLPNASIEYYADFFEKSKANELFEKLKAEIPWQHEDITVFGKTYPQPRLTSLFGNEGKPYSYSNIIMQPNPWNPLLMFIKNEIETVCQENFTTVLLNFYRDGKDSNGWHADNEKELGKNPVIASASFGAERMFHLKHNSIEDQKLKINLEHGSLLIMKGETQHFWKHQIPKTNKPIGPRINLTFRILK
ncbi:alpha-ketoglutarate-dependent dioxygenase AlkB family protein [Flavobacterium capsici]|uniref:Alpha-ketoglutarate-dependent dioxygenase AlkB n=1 Tax=Flavobacterium capsici TaxID=3075618 RepID=A0AA96J4A5_9FLAO|nr:MULTISPECIES: alpha-ketoglutarate-dependent dioxygenase AlkB [unclassified Flavobacterium]WNM20293.1 alpha-ketoglutarate-dependent dioxygenase AlkB [Flavobacterium sp. PMR2A8]WNM21683.1 alpha-ketoglutarate-dependent dioxygenase AlkB [Flavobacterium sp. PMTSA4]